MVEAETPIWNLSQHVTRMATVAVIIVNWNGKDDTIACLESMTRLTTYNVQLTTIVVDNGSQDGSVTLIRTCFPHVTVIDNQKNLGFTGGNNVGIRWALDHGTDFVWLLNNDTIVDKNALSALVAVLDNNRDGIAGSKIYFFPGREYHKERYSGKDRGRVIWYAGGCIDWENMYATHRGVDEVDRGQYDTQKPTQFVTGCSMMVKREVFENIGLLDEKFFMYLEDLDFCLRAKRAGFQLLYVPTSVIWHVNAGSSGGAGNEIHEYYLTRNRLIVGLRYAPIRTKIALLRESLRFFLVGSSVKRKAVIDAFIGRFGYRYESKKI